MSNIKSELKNLNRSTSSILEAFRGVLPGLFIAGINQDARKKEYEDAVLLAGHMMCINELGSRMLDNYEHEEVIYSYNNDYRDNTLRLIQEAKNLLSNIDGYNPQFTVTNIKDMDH